MPPPKGRSGKKVQSQLRNLPHKLYCERCDISIMCPKRKADDATDQNNVVFEIKQEEEEKERDNDLTKEADEDKIEEEK